MLPYLIMRLFCTTYTSVFTYDVHNFTVTYIRYTSVPIIKKNYFITLTVTNAGAAFNCSSSVSVTLIRVDHFTGFTVLRNFNK